MINDRSSTRIWSPTILCGLGHWPKIIHDFTHRLTQVNCVFFIFSPLRWRTLCRYREQLPGKRTRHLQEPGARHSLEDGELPKLAARWNQFGLQMANCFYVLWYLGSLSLNGQDEIGITVVIIEPQSLMYARLKSKDERPARLRGLAVISHGTSKQAVRMVLV